MSMLRLFEKTFLSRNLPAFLLSFMVGVVIIFSGIQEALSQNNWRSWKTYQNERFGYYLLYPSQIFFPEPPPANNDGLTFLSRDGQAELVVYGAYNTERQSPRSYRDELLDDMRGRATIDYKPIGKTWFVLSGFVDNKIYYQKVQFSCRGDKISAFALSYPERDRALYDPIVERIEDSFKPGRGC